MGNLIFSKYLLCFIKATEGSSFVDEHFAYNYAEARKTDLAVGAYHFFSYDSPGAAQAENFINTVAPHAGMLPPVIDVEFYGDKEKKSAGKGKDVFCSAESDAYQTGKNTINENQSFTQRKTLMPYT